MALLWITVLGLWLAGTPGAAGSAGASSQRATAPGGTAATGPVSGADAMDRRHRVSDGETVWSIARELARDGDPRPIVDAIVELNHLSGALIVPGQRLLLPTLWRGETSRRLQACYRRTCHNILCHAA